MPVSVIVSEDMILRGIWMGALVLCVLSFFIVSMLIVRRVFQDSKARRTAIRRKELSRFLYAAIKSPIALTETSVPKLSQDDVFAALQVALDMLRALRGQDANRIIDILALWRMSERLESVVEHSGKGRRIQALTLLGYIQDDNALDIMLASAEDTDIYVQMAALRGLAKRDEIEHLPFIVDCLSKASNTNTFLLADVLKHFGKPATPYLLQLANLDAEVEIRLAAIMAVGFIGALDSVDGLIILTKDESLDVRAKAIAALGRIGDRRAAEAILANIESEDDAVRIQVIRALGRIREISAMPKLHQALSDDNWWIRYRAAEALFQFGSKGQALLRAVSKEKDNAGIIASQVLGELEGSAV